MEVKIKKPQNLKDEETRPVLLGKIIERELDDIFTIRKTSHLTTEEVHSIITSSTAKNSVYTPFVRDYGH